MPRCPPEQPSDLPPELSETIAAMSLDQLRETTGQLLDLAGARARLRDAPVPTRRRRRRAKEPFAVTVRVDLVGAKPPVWRRLVLPSTLRLDQLHGVLQAVFDWTDSHLHRFTLDDEPWGDGEKYLCPYDVEEGEDDGVPESDVRLDEVLAAPGDVLTYLYDYGDDWHHRLVVARGLRPAHQVPDVVRMKCWQAPPTRPRHTTCGVCWPAARRSLSRRPPITMSLPRCTARLGDRVALSALCSTAWSRPSHCGWRRPSWRVTATSRCLLR